MTSEFIESLGWKADEYWNNRLIYSLGNSCIFEHNGSIGILTSEAFKYVDLTEEELQKYTEIVKNVEEVKAHPDKHTYKEALDAFAAKTRFIKLVQNR